MRVALIQVPYHLGESNVGVGRGPLRLRERGLGAALREAGFDVDWQRADRGAPFDGALTAAVRIGHDVSSRVGKALAENRFPIVLGGNCNASLGALIAVGAAGAGLPATGLVWFDAHGDFNTPDTTESGFLDGMTLGIATGRCYADQWRAMGGGEPLRDANILLAGIRDLDRGEEEALARSSVHLARSGDLAAASGESTLTAELDDIRSRAGEAYVHIDVDALDPAEVPGTEYPTPGGLSRAQMESVLRHVGQRFDIRGAAIASFSPDHDKHDRTADLCNDLVVHIAGMVRDARGRNSREEAR